MRRAILDATRPTRSGAPSSRRRRCHQHPLRGIAQNGPGPSGNRVSPAPVRRRWCPSPTSYGLRNKCARRPGRSGRSTRRRLVRCPGQRELVTRKSEFLVLRLQSALELTDDDVRPGMPMCDVSPRGAGMASGTCNARLLYDLQQGCLDHEQEMSRVNLLAVFAAADNPQARFPQSSPLADFEATAACGETESRSQNRRRGPARAERMRTSAGRCRLAASSTNDSNLS